MLISLFPLVTLPVVFSDSMSTAMASISASNDEAAEGTGLLDAEAVGAGMRDDDSAPIGTPWEGVRPALLLMAPPRLGVVADLFELPGEADNDRDRCLTEPGGGGATPCGRRRLLALPTPAAPLPRLRLGLGFGRAAVVEDFIARDEAEALAEEGLEAAALKLRRFPARVAANVEAGGARG
jgi:hypothetical protein